MLHAFFVILGAGLWATDTLFRQPLTEELSSVTIVAFEHLFATLASLLWALASSPRKLLPGWKELIGAILIGALGSGVATIFFTESFLYVNPSVSILLQKIQPLLVIGLSAAFLGERPSRHFLTWATIAIGAAYLLSFPEGVPEDVLDRPSHVGAGMALLAAFFWAVSTVMGRAVLSHTPPAVLSFWRFLAGLVATFALSRFSAQSRLEIPFVFSNVSVLKSIAAMALIPGFLGVLLYYQGLSRIRASTATLLELSFPLAAILINSRVLGFQLERMQIIAGSLLAVAMVVITLNGSSPAAKSKLD